METPALNNTLDYMDLLDVYRTFCLKAAEYTFFSSVHGTFSRIDHMLSHKISLNKFKKTEVISCIFSDHTMKREIIHKKNTWKAGKYTEKPGNTQMLNNMLLNNDWVNQEIKDKIKKYMEANENENKIV